MAQPTKLSRVRRRFCGSSGYGGVVALYWLRFTRGRRSRAQRATSVVWLEVEDRVRNMETLN